MNRGKLFWGVMAAATVILVYQLFIPPVIGLADQGDFRRMIGRFGYGPAHPGEGIALAWVEPKYAPNPNFRAPEWEQFSSEYLFVAAALLINKVVSKNGSLDITVVGFVHALAFLAILARFLFITRKCRARAVWWIGTVVIFTDVGYVAYWNSLFAEPASGLFALLLLTESADILMRGRVSGASLIRWSLSAILLAFAKPQNAPVGLLLALFCALVLSSWTTTPTVRHGAWISSVAIVAAAATVYLTTPQEIRDHSTYNLVFLAIVPESRNASADLTSLGLDPRLRDYSTTGAWSPNTAFPTLQASGAIGRVVTPLTGVRFYVLRPTRLWRHIQSMLPVATSLRPEWCGNFEPSAGNPAGARSSAFALWSGFHERVLVHAFRLILFLLPVPPLVAILRRIRRAPNNLRADFFGLLTACCLAAFLTALFGDAWDNVKHLYLFNLLLDACLLSCVAWAAQQLRRSS